MPQNGKNNDLLDKDTLDNSEAQDLAAKILRRDKTGRIKKITIEEKIETKASGGKASASEGKKRAGSGNGLEETGGRNNRQRQPAGQGGEKADGQKSGQESAKPETGQKSGQSDEKKQPPAGQGDDKQKQARGAAGKNQEEPGGKNGQGKPGEQSGQEPGGAEEPGQKGQGAGGEGKPKDQEKPQSEDNDAKPGDEEKGKKEDEQKPEEEEEPEKPQTGPAGEKSGDDKKSADQPDDENGGAGGAGDRAARGQPESRGGKTGARPAPESGNLDNRLLNPEDENDAARELREKKSSSAKATEDESAEAGTEAGQGEPSSGENPDDESRSLRQRVQAARRKLNLKEQAKKKLEEKVTAPAKQGTNWLLKAAWLNLIDSFGLTLIYINMHVFLRWVFPDLFCKLGEEWLPKTVASESSAKNVAGTAFGIIEVIGLLIIDLILLAVIISALSFIVMIVDFMRASVWEKIKMFIGGLTNLNWSVIKALYKLFKS